jgi:hypothetical protein
MCVLYNALNTSFVVSLTRYIYLNLSPTLDPSSVVTISKSTRIRHNRVAATLRHAKPTAAHKHIVAQFLQSPITSCILTGTTNTKTATCAVPKVLPPRKGRFGEIWGMLAPQSAFGRRCSSQEFLALRHDSNGASAVKERRSTSVFPTHDRSEQSRGHSLGIVYKSIIGCI